MFSPNKIFFVLLIAQMNGKRVQRSKYPFLGYLFMYSRPEFKCTGAIVAERWILDFCESTEEYKYDYIKIGTESSIGGGMDYELDKVVHHPSFDPKRTSTLRLANQKVDIHAPDHAIFLHRTKLKIESQQGGVGFVRISRKPALPSSGRLIFYSWKNKQVIQKAVKVFTQKNKCDKFYKKYNRTLDKFQFCVDTSKLNVDECCGSFAFLEYRYIIYGMMAWSTPCWRENRLEPWVFSNLAHYYKWISYTVSVPM